MKTYLSETVRTAEGEQLIHIEVDTPTDAGRYKRFDYGQTRDESKGGGKTKMAADTFAQGMSLIRTCAEQVAQTVAEVSEKAKPSGVEVQLGIKLDGEVGALIAKTGVEAQLQVKLSWGK
jgi:hypothetical protein